MTSTESTTCMKKNIAPPKDMPLMKSEGNNIVLFHPFIPPSAKSSVANVLSSRWIGQGPKVDEFELAWEQKFGGRTISVNSGTSALHLAYELAELRPEDEVIVPLFTCTATNIPLAQIGAKLIFSDVGKNTLNVDVDDLIKLTTIRTKAIVVVHYAGQPLDMAKLWKYCKENNIILIQDCAHGIGMEIDRKPVYKYADYTMYSLQAIKTITVGDGGMLTFNDNISPQKISEAKRRRWFGIDRQKKQGGIWENDIVELGHKWQMTDLSASIGIESLKYFDEVHQKRVNNLITYSKRLSSLKEITQLNMKQSDNIKHGGWLATISVSNRLQLQEFLYSHGIESNQVHYRNDRYSIFSKYTQGASYPNMDEIENDYLVLPCHHLVTVRDVNFICDKIEEFYAKNSQ